MIVSVSVWTACDFRVTFSFQFKDFYIVLNRTLTVAETQPIVVDVTS